MTNTESHILAVQRDAYRIIVLLLGPTRFGADNPFRSIADVDQMEATVREEGQPVEIAVAEIISRWKGQEDHLIGVIVGMLMSTFEALIGREQMDVVLKTLGKTVFERTTPYLEGPPPDSS